MYSMYIPYVSVHLGMMNLEVILASLEVSICSIFTRKLEWFTKVFKPVGLSPLSHN